MPPQLPILSGVGESWGDGVGRGVGLGFGVGVAVGQGVIVGMATKLLADWHKPPKHAPEQQSWLLAQIPTVLQLGGGVDVGEIFGVGVGASFVQLFATQTKPVQQLPALHPYPPSPRQLGGGFVGTGVVVGTGGVLVGGVQSFVP